MGFSIEVLELNNRKFLYKWTSAYVKAVNFETWAWTEISFYIAMSEIFGNFEVTQMIFPRNILIGF